MGIASGSEGTTHSQVGSMYRPQWSHHLHWWSHLQITICIYILPHPGWKQQTRLQRGFGSKKPSCLLHPAAALMGSEGSQTAWAVNFTSLVLITAVHHDLGWLDVARKCIDPRLFSVGPLCWTGQLTWTIRSHLPRCCLVCCFAV